MKMTKELITDKAGNDLYSNHESPDKRISYEEIYWILLSGFGLLIGSACVLVSYLA